MTAGLAVSPVCLVQLVNLAKMVLKELTDLTVTLANRVPLAHRASKATQVFKAMPVFLAKRALKVLMVPQANKELEEVLVSQVMLSSILTTLP